MLVEASRCFSLCVNILTFSVHVSPRRGTSSTVSLGDFWWGKPTSWAGPTPAPLGERCRWRDGRLALRQNIVLFFVSCAAEAVDPIWWLSMTSSSRNRWRSAPCYCSRHRSESVPGGEHLTTCDVSGLVMKDVCWKTLVRLLKGMTASLGRRCESLGRPGSHSFQVAVCGIAAWSEFPNHLWSCWQETFDCRWNQIWIFLLWSLIDEGFKRSLCVVSVVWTDTGFKRVDCSVMRADVTEGCVMYTLFSGTHVIDMTSNRVKISKSCCLCGRSQMTCHLFVKH